ncbi:hypothetical protein CEUSTIGMA_g12304.t1 [Chlamydomonas eustigma]|uniref:Uncharacterized protein n=1 Tax=Chlamydomonas eustigma TaxID=1157962 RepID=A0A250XPF8_9CHLO|nr:hypothetical protein CEUSTIGMA_g12304.t1 [Chlamydomonas eustigma]|eukprot:GAX84883.1 hypothetical protein CEUSTIGMA_g12304.t1 [Chlamydomonas eustigma]
MSRLAFLHPGDWNSPDLFTWTTWAPAPLDNYMTRTLLGRHFMCKDFGDLEERHLSSAALTLSTMDHILVLGEDALNDVAMRVGLGWAKTLRSKHFRCGPGFKPCGCLLFPAAGLQRAVNTSSHTLWQ